jgi:hypothetical protein
MKTLSLLTLTAVALVIPAGIWTMSAIQADDGPAPNHGNSVGHRMDGRQTFENEEFGGNGRTCSTCHSDATGTVTPAEVEARFAQDPTEPLFRAKDSDNGDGISYTRLRTLGLFTVKVATHPDCLPCSNPPTLPPLAPTCTVDLVNPPTEVTHFRGTGNTINTAPLDHALMLDGRFANLEDQALGAVHAHYDNTEEPDDKDLQRIAQFQHTRRFFSSDELYEFDNGGPAPVLPPGTTPEEIRGKTFIEPNGLCGKCHSGPMLNMKSAFNQSGAGGRFAQSLVNAIRPNPTANPPVIPVLPETVPNRAWRIKNAQGVYIVRNYHDAGHMLQTGLINHFGQFRIPSLWNVKNTAPYFHNNSAADLDILLRHYQQFFAQGPIEVPGSAGQLDNQELIDIKAYLLLL